MTNTYGCDIDTLKNLVTKRYTQRQIADHIGCSEATIRRRLKSFDLVTNPIQNFQGHSDNPQLCTCACGCNDPINFYFRDKAHTRIRNDVCKDCIAARKSAIGRRHKIKAVQLFGSRCNRCAFTTNVYQVYDFHHFNPSNKHNSKLRHAFNPNWRWSRIEDQLKHCEMLCGNCHRIEHSGLSNRGQIASITSQYTIDGYRRTKTRILDYFGDKCLDCNVCYEQHQVYDLHHLDPLSKEYGLKDLVKRKWDIILPELEKCVLLCVNCHRTRHALEV